MKRDATRLSIAAALLPLAAWAETQEVPAAPEDGGPRHFEVQSALNLREQPTTSSPVQLTYAQGTILSNLGCQRAEGRTWCDVQEITGGARGYVAAEFIEPAISPDGSVAYGPDDSALRAGRGDFDATGTIPCAEAAGQPMSECKFGVARAGGGAATVVVIKPGGSERIIFFTHGIAIGYSMAEADNPGKFAAIEEEDIHRIRIGDERYEIFDAVVLGG